MRTIAFLMLCACIAALLLFAACGGGGGGDGGGGTTTVVLHADPDLDGLVSNSGWICFSPSCGVPLTGDWGGTFPSNRSYQTRQLYGFYLGDLPPGVRIVRATLRLYQAHVEGSPFTKIGNVVVDHVDYFADPGPDSFNAQTLQARFGTLSTSAALGPRTLNVTTQVASDWTGGRLWNQYRIYFWKSALIFFDEVNDVAYFTDAEDSGFEWYGEVPELVVEYE